MNTHQQLTNEWNEVARIAKQALALIEVIEVKQKVKQAWLDGRYYQLKNMI